MRSVLALVAIVGVVLGVLWGFQRRLIYIPLGTPPPVDEVLPAADAVVLTTADGLELDAWHLPASAGAPTVLVASGNAGHRGLRAPLAEALGRAGLGVLLFDYRGFGDNPGTPSEDGLVRDAAAAREFLVDDAGVEQELLIYYGESIGGGVLTALSISHPPAGLVLRSPFTDLASVGRRHYPFLPVGTLLRDRYPLAEQIAEITVPTVVVLGTRDGIVPPEESRAVARVAAGPTRTVEIEGADHNDRALLDGPELVDAVVELAERVGKAP